MPAPAFSYKLPSTIIERLSNVSSSLKLAEDDLAYNSVDMIIGAEFYSQCIDEGQAEIAGMKFTETKFGWALIGSIDKDDINPPALTTFACGIAIRDIDSQMKRL